MPFCLFGNLKTDLINKILQDSEWVMLLIDTFFVLLLFLLLGVLVFCFYKGMTEKKNHSEIERMDDKIDLEKNHSDQAKMCGNYSSLGRTKEMK